MASIAFYQYLVAAALGMIPMPLMDQAVFITSSKANVNFISVSFFDGDFDEAFIAEKYHQYIGNFEKFSYYVEMVAGDLYYRKMSKEVAFDRGFHFERDPEKAPRNRREIEMWAEDNLNKKLPLDGPQWRCFAFMYKNPEENNKLQLVQLWRSHHSFMDGVSSMALTGWSTDDYGRHNFIKFKDPSLFQQMALRILSPVFWVLLCFQTVWTSRDVNLFTKNKKKMTGQINCASSPIFDVN